MSSLSTDQTVATQESNSGTLLSHGGPLARERVPTAWSPTDLDRELQHVRAAFAGLLCTKPRGTTADITDQMVVYWDGTRSMGVHLCADDPGFDYRFELDHHFYGHAHGQLVDWFAHPRYSSRPELVAWLDVLDESISAQDSMIGR